MSAQMQNLKSATHHLFICNDTRAVLSQGEPRDAAVNFDKKNLQRHHAVSVPQHAFPV